MRKFLLLTALLFPVLLSAQCTLLPTAVAGVVLRYQNTALLNCSGVAYNTNMGLYYGVRAGNPSFPLETWDAIGTQLYTTTAGFDYRGMWWNPTTGQMEANGYASSGIWRANLNGSGYALNTGATIFSGMLQPDAQSCGDLDYDSYEIIYYFSGSIYRYSRATGAFLGSAPLTGTPVPLGNLNSTTIMYTGCPTMEIALLDYVNKRVYLYNKATRAYTGMSQLPAAAVTTSMFRTSWANGYIWLFDLATFTWYSYDIFDVPLPVSVNVFEAVRASDNVNLRWETTREEGMASYTLMRSEDGINFSPVTTVPAQQSDEAAYNYTDVSPSHGDYLYYQLEMTGTDGRKALSSVRTLSYSETVLELVTFPNPVAEELYWDVQGAADEAMKIRVLDMAGRKVLSKNVSTRGSVNVSDLPAGVYTFVAELNGEVMREQVVVER